MSVDYEYESNMEQEQLTSPNQSGSSIVSWWMTTDNVSHLHTLVIDLFTPSVLGRSLYSFCLSFVDFIYLWRVKWGLR